MVFFFRGVGGGEFLKEMADSDFEEFCRYFEELPQHIKASARSYKLVHDVVEDEEYIENPTICVEFNYKYFATLKINFRINRRIRELKYNRKNIRNYVFIFYYETIQSPSFFYFLFFFIDFSDINFTFLTRQESFNVFTTYFNAINSFSPDSELFDSGNSTAHSPDVFYFYEYITDSLIVGSTNHSSNGSFIRLELLEATHRALHRFFARHSDELELEIGDPIYVQKEAEDLWCEGINLRNGSRGIFPSAYVVDVEYNDFDPTAPQLKRERFLLTYLGSVETLYHKGNSVLCQAVHKITSSKETEYHSCILEVSDQGLKMYDRLKPCRDNIPTLDYFYSLKNVSFCGFHPKDSRFMGFITKHPHCDRFACHVFQAEESTRPITESIGRAFQRFYQKYIETAYPTEDIYIE
ncbi:hypothetical protein PGB90_005885 [Kerria lacca]